MSVCPTSEPQRRVGLLSPGRPAEPADVHGVLLLALLHRGQSVHRAAQVRSWYSQILRKQSKGNTVCLFMLKGFMRSTACWRHSTTQHSRHGRTPNIWVSSRSTAPHHTLAILWLSTTFLHIPEQIVHFLYLICKVTLFFTWQYLKYLIVPSPTGCLHINPLVILLDQLFHVQLVFQVFLCCFFMSPRSQRDTSGHGPGPGPGPGPCQKIS